MAAPNNEGESGSLLLDLLTLTGWQIETANGDRVEAVAQRLYDGKLLTAEASGATLSEVSMRLFESACDAAWTARRRGASSLAA
jgi:hypothetical protein